VQGLKKAILTALLDSDKYRPPLFYVQGLNPRIEAYPRRVRQRSASSSPTRRRAGCLAPNPGIAQAVDPARSELG
jgi:hypothetical protein